MNTQEAKDRAQGLLRETDTAMRANPVPAVLTALGIGFALGLLLRYLEPAPKREPWLEAMDEIRGALANSAKRGRKASEHSAEAVRDAVEQAVDKAREIDVDPLTRFWKKLWS